MATVNYMGDYGNQKYQSKDRIGFSLKDDVDFLIGYRLILELQEAFIVQRVIMEQVVIAA